MNQKLSFRSAFLIILFSTFLVSGTTVLGFLYYENQKELRKRNDLYKVVSVVQSCMNSEPLKTAFLIELLDLSIDNPLNLYQFNIKEAQKKLLSCPIIKTATIKKVLPGTIYIEYEIREPIAFLADLSNSAIDSDGNILPYSSFFPTKNLPSISLGNDIESQEEKALLAIYLLRKIQEAGLKPKRIDVSHAFAQSYGQREVIVSFDDHFVSYLRIGSENYSQQIANFLTFLSYFQKLKPKQKIIVVDLRIPDLAFITEDS